MRILHLVTAFPRDERDIIAPWLIELVKRQRAAGHDAQVFAPAYHGSADHSFAGIPVHRFRYFFSRWESLTHDESAADRMQRSLLFRLMPAPFVVAGMLAIWRLCRREPYDVIHVHWPVPLALWGWAARRARRSAVVLTFYGIELRWVKRSLTFLKGFVRWACRWADRVVAISSETAREIRELVDVPVDVIPYTTPFPSPPHGHRSPRALAAGDGKLLTILFIGRLVELKGLAYLIEAAGLLRVTPRIVVIGIGPERERLEALARDRRVDVDFRNKVPDAELHQAFLTSDVLVLPSIIDARGDTEGLGVALLDAMSYGIPAIGTRVGGIPDIIEDGVSGLLVPPADPRALADAIERVARDPAYAQRLADAGRERLRTHFSWDVITKKWDAVYRTASAGLPSASSNRS